MSSKKAELYKEVFDYLEKKLIRLNPASFMADFEAGLRKAINEYYPEAILFGCWFHFCAAVRRKCLSFNMHKLITTVPAARSIYRMILSLPLLPSNSILEGYEIVKREATSEGLDKEFQKIFKYFEEFWLFLVSSKFVFLS